MEGVPSKGGHPRGNSFLVGVVPKRGPSKVGEPSKEVYSMGPIQGGGGGIMSIQGEPSKKFIKGGHPRRPNPKGVFTKGISLWGSTKGYIQEGPINKSPSQGSLFNGAPMHMLVWQCRVTTYRPPNQVWCLGEGWLHPTNRTVDRGTHRLEIPLPVSGARYCIQVAAFNGAGLGVPSNATCSVLGRGRGP